MVGPPPLRWWQDWRNGAVLVAALLLGLLTAVWLNDEQHDGERTVLLTSELEASETTREEMLDQLSAVKLTIDEQATQIASLHASIEALRQQLIGLGVDPVVAPAVPRHTGTTVTTAPRRAPPARPTTTTTDAPGKSEKAKAKK